MKRILFPTAYSNHSKTAYQYALKLAQHFGAGITLVHIYHSFSINLDIEAELMEKGAVNDEPGQMEEFQREDELQKLKSFTKDFDSKQFQNIPLDFIVSEGVVMDELLKIEAQRNFDLTIMGMSRINLIDRLFGKTAYQAIYKMTCPILLIPPDIKFLGINKIVYGTAFEYGNIKHFDHLLDWCEAFNATIYSLHVYKKEEVRKATDELTSLINYFEKENEAGLMEFRIREGEIVEILETYVRLTNADVLTIHHRKEGFWKRIKEGSLMKKMAKGVQVPLLVLRDE